jgi:Macrocin-O-methyltransferase (TylF)
VRDDQWAEGKNWPALALTMVGTKRLDNLQHCVLTVVKDGVPGDFIETGGWRGGSVILMRAILRAAARCHRSHGVRGRLVCTDHHWTGPTGVSAEGRWMRNALPHWHVGRQGAKDDCVNRI